MILVHTPHYGAKHGISVTAASICMCDTVMESSLNGLIGGKFILHRGAISTRRACPTVIAMPLVLIYCALREKTGLMTINVSWVAVVPNT